MLGEIANTWVPLNKQKKRKIQGFDRYFKSSKPILDLGLEWVVYYWVLNYLLVYLGRYSNYIHPSLIGKKQKKMGMKSR